MALEEATGVLEKLQEEHLEEEMLKHQEDLHRQEHFAEKDRKKEEARKASEERIREEIQRRQALDQQAIRKQEMLAKIEADREKTRLARKELQDVARMHQELEDAEDLAKMQALDEEKNKEKEKEKEKPVSTVETKPMTAVKEEPIDLEDAVESELSELSSLRLCKVCNCRLYIRQGLCANMACPNFYLLDPDAPAKICARGSLKEGRKWSPAEWKQSQMNRVESQQLLMEYENSIKEFQPEIEAAIHEQQTPRVLPMPSAPAVVIEDLTDGSITMHPPEGGAVAAEASGAEAPEVQDFESMDAKYKAAVFEASKRKRSKGLKRVLNLHAAISRKKSKGEWIGPQTPVALSQLQQEWLDSKVAKAISSAPWRQQDNTQFEKKPFWKKWHG